jgi:hypothetical protein
MTGAPAPLQLTGPEQSVVLRNMLAKALQDAGNTPWEPAAVAAAFAAVILDLDKHNPGSAIRARIIGTLEAA